LTVVDHGTGLGSSLVEVLTLSQTEAQAVAARSTGVTPGLAPNGDDPASGGLGAAEVSLRPHRHDPGLVDVAVTGVAGFVDSAYRRTMLADSLLNRLTRARLDADTTHPRLHGGAVSDPDGRGVLVLGMSGSGKSTLVASLAASGLHLLNDEQVTVFRSAEMVAGFTRPVAVKPGGGAHLPVEVRPDVPDVDHTQLVSAATLGAVHALTAHPVLIVLPDRTTPGSVASVTAADRGVVGGDGLVETGPEPVAAGAGVDDAFAGEADRPDPRAGIGTGGCGAGGDGGVDAGSGGGEPAVAVRWRVLEPGDALQELCGNNLDLVTRPAEGLAAFAWLAATVPVVRLHYADVADAVPVVARLLDAPPEVDRLEWSVTSSPDEHDAPAPAPAVDLGDAGFDAVVRVADAVQTVRLGGQVFLFHPESRQLVELNGSGGALWDTLPWPDLAVDDPDLAAVTGFALDLVERGLVKVAGAPAATYRRVDGLVHRRIRGRVLVSDRQHSITTLEGSSAVVWDMLDSPADLITLLARIRADQPDGVDPAVSGPDDGSAADGNDPDPLARAEMARMVDEALAGLVGSGLVESMASPVSCRSNPRVRSILVSGK